MLPFIFAAEIPNKGHGHSDFDGLVSSFHALDESYSAMINYIRKTKPNLFVTENLVPKGPDGRGKTFNEFDTVITMLDNPAGGETTEINRQTIDIQVGGYRQTFETIRDLILQKAGISPSTLGIDSAGANASGEALSIRERASARTRSEKLAV
jgi:hypothetical protein